MKTRFLLIAATGALIAACTTTSNVVPMDDRVHQVTIDTGRDQASAYRIANEWLVDMFRSAEAFIQYQDKAEGVIKGKATFPGIWTSDKGAMSLKGALSLKGTMSIKCTITVEVKDNRARVSFDGMEAVPIISDNIFAILAAVYSQPAHDAFVEYADALVVTLQDDMLRDSDEW